MTVLAFNAIGASFLNINNSKDGFLALAASLFTALVHLWKRNTLLSIFGGTALYMILMR
jgi:branched-subunit amino acid transport protein AzlD